MRFTADGPDATNVELVHHKFETMGAEVGASMRKMSIAAGLASLSTLPGKLNAEATTETIMSEFIIHGHPASPFLRSVCLGLEEKGAPYGIKAMAVGETRSDAHRRLHPFGRIPVLEHGDDKRRGCGSRCQTLPGRAQPTLG